MRMQEGDPACIQTCSADSALFLAKEHATKQALPGSELQLQGMRRILTDAGLVLGDPGVAAPL